MENKTTIVYTGIDPTLYGETLETYQEHDAKNRLLVDSMNLPHYSNEENRYSSGSF